MLVCASSFLSQTQKFAPPADGVPPLGDGNADSSLRIPSFVGSTPTQNPRSAAGISPSQSLKFTAPLIGQTSTRK